MTPPMKLSASLEDYLEAIFHLVSQKHAARSRDIAKRLKVNRSSVTGALQSLADKGLVNYEPYEAITLTRAGKAIGKSVVRRHEVLRDFLVKVLLVDPIAADQAACRMEHAVPLPVLERLVQFVEFIDLCPRSGAKWIRGFGYQCDEGGAEACERCISSCLEDAKNARVGNGRPTVAALKALTPRRKGNVT